MLSQNSSPQDAGSDVLVHPELALELKGSTGIVRFVNGADKGIIPIRDYEVPIRGMAKRDECRTVEFDLNNVAHIPSGLLGMMVSLIKVDSVAVQVRNCSSEVREALEVTRLDQIVAVVS